MTPYYIRLFIIGRNGQNGVADQEVYLQTTRTPSITLSCLRNCNQYLQLGTPMILRADCHKRCNFLNHTWEFTSHGNKYEICSNQFTCRINASLLETVVGDNSAGISYKVLFGHYMDLMFIMDGSGSVGPGNFIKMKEFVNNVADAFNETIGVTTQLAVLQYGHLYYRTVNGIIQLNYFHDPHYRQPVYFDTCDSIDCFKQAVSNMDYLRGLQTYTYSAIRRAIELDFQSSKNVEFASKYIVVTTDGDATPVDYATRGVVEKIIDDNNITMFAVGVGRAWGNQKFERQILQLARGNPDHVFRADDFDQLNRIVSTLANKVWTFHTGVSGFDFEKTPGSSVNVAIIVQEQLDAVNCTVNPGMGEAFVTRFTITCDTDNSTGSATTANLFLYRFYISNHAHNVLLQSGYSNLLANFTLPPPTTITNITTILVEKCKDLQCVDTEVFVLLRHNDVEVDKTDVEKSNCSFDAEGTKRFESLVKEIDTSLATRDLHRLAQVLRLADPTHIFCSNRSERIITFLLDCPANSIDDTEYVTDILSHITPNQFNVTTISSTCDYDVSCSLLNDCNFFGSIILRGIYEDLLEENTRLTSYKLNLLVTSSFRAGLNAMLVESRKTEETPEKAICLDHRLHEIGHLVFQNILPNDPPFAIDHNIFNSTMANFAHVRAGDTVYFYPFIIDNFSNPSDVATANFQIHSYDATKINFNSTSKEFTRVHTLSITSGEPPGNQLVYDPSNRMEFTYPATLNSYADPYHYVKLDFLPKLQCSGSVCRLVATKTVYFERSDKPLIYLLLHNHGDYVRELNVTLNATGKTVSFERHVQYTTKEPWYEWATPLDDGHSSEMVNYTLKFDAIMSSPFRTNLTLNLNFIKCASLDHDVLQWSSDGCEVKFGFYIFLDYPRCHCGFSLTPPPSNCTDVASARPAVFASYFSTEANETKPVPETTAPPSTYPATNPTSTTNISTSSTSASNASASTPSSTKPPYTTVVGGEESTTPADQDQIDPEMQLLDYEEVESNLIPITFMVILHTSYIVWAILITVKDKRDKLKEIADEIEEIDGDFNYNLIIHTDYRLFTMPKSDITIQLVGSKHTSEVKTIQVREHNKHYFTRDSVQSISVKSTKELGSITNLKVRRHEDQENLQWFFRRIVVHDVGKNQCCFFIRNEEDTRNHINLPAATIGQVENRSYLFWCRLESNFKDRHMLFSLTSVTSWHHRVMGRLDRLGVFYMTVFMHCLSTLALHGRQFQLSSDDTSDMPIAKGMLSSLMVVPLTAMLGEFFPLCREKKKEEDINQKKTVDGVKMTIASTADYKKIRGGSKTEQLRTTEKQFHGLEEVSRITLQAKELESREFHKHQRRRSSRLSAHAVSAPDEADEQNIEEISDSDQTRKSFIRCFSITKSSEPKADEQNIEEINKSDLTRKSGVKRVSVAKSSEPNESPGQISEKLDSAQQQKSTIDRRPIDGLFAQNNLRDESSKQSTAQRRPSTMSRRSFLATTASIDEGSSAQDNLCSETSKENATQRRVSYAINRRSFLVSQAPSDDDMDEISTEPETKPNRRTSAAVILVGEKTGSGATNNPVRKSSVASKRGLPSVSGGASKIRSGSYSTPQRFEADDAETKVNDRLTDDTSTEDPFSDTYYPLPYYFHQVAWFFIISTVLISTVLCLVIATPYGYDLSLEWVASTLVAILFSLFFVEPLKTLVLGMVSLYLNPKVDLRDWFSTKPRP